jgi:hypothetical protein
MPAIICVPNGGGLSDPHSMPATIGIEQHATFMLPLKSSFFLDSGTASISFNIDPQIDLVFKGLGKVRTTSKPFDRQCVFTATEYVLTGTFRGTTFVNVNIDGVKGAAIRVDVV